MKKTIFIVVSLLAGIGLSYALFFKGNADALQVNQVAADPAAYSGPVTITGIMAGTSQQDPTIFGMIDLKELQCNSPNCNKLYLPVKYRGSLPKLGDEVRVSGTFTQMGGGYIFSATDMKVVRNHKIGG